MGPLKGSRGSTIQCRRHAGLKHIVSSGMACHAILLDMCGCLLVYKIGDAPQLPPTMNMLPSMAATACS